MKVTSRHDRLLSLLINLIITAMLFWSVVVSQTKLYRLERQMMGLERSLADATSLGCEEDEEETEP